MQVSIANAEVNVPIEDAVFAFPEKAAAKKQGGTP
jgi:hypothetical protein